VILSKIFNLTKKNINNINILFIKGKGYFGNYFNSLNNAIIYCEYLDCKKIIIENNNNIYIIIKYFIRKAISLLSLIKYSIIRRRIQLF